MKKIFLSIIMFLIIAANTNAQQKQDNTLTINKAISLTLQNYPLIIQAKQKVDIFDARIAEQKSNYYPDINAIGSYNRIGPVPSIVFPGQGLFKLYPENNYDAHISVSHNLYDFGRRGAEMDIAESYKTSAADNVQLLKTNLTFATIQTYYTILFLEKSIAVIDTDIATLNQHIDITNKKIKNGTATEYDLLSTKVRIADYQSRKVDQQNELRKQYINLKHLTGLPADYNLNISGKFSPLMSDINVDSLIEAAFRQRPEIKLAKDQEQIAKLKENAASLGDLPIVGLNLSYGIKNGYIPNLDVLRGNWVAGVEVKVPIFNGFRTKSQEDEAKANARVAETGTLNLKLQIKSEVEKAAADVNSNLQQIKIAEDLVELAKQSLVKAQAQYSSGVGTNLDLLEAETKLADAEFLYLKSVYMNIINSYNLKEAVGEIVFNHEAGNNN